MKASYTVKLNRLIAITLFTMFCGMQVGKAQLSPLGGVYFQNQYLGNPAMAGLHTNLILNLGYRQQWSSIPGSPQTQSLTAAYGVTDKVGLGLNIYNDEAGLLKRTRVMGTYAYHLPVGSEEQKLSFGLSLGVMNERVGYEEMKGDPGDQSVSRFNQKEMFIDGDFGLAYTSDKLTLQGAIPNMKGFFKKDEFNHVDRSLFFTAISYKFDFPQYLEGLAIEPKAVFRGVRGFHHIGDFGANITFAADAVSLMGMYHTSQSATFGMGINFQKRYSILGLYTSQTSALSGYTGGNFELALRASFL